MARASNPRSAILNTHPPEYWPEPHASLIELEPIKYYFSKTNPKPMCCIDPLTTRECMIICEFWSMQHTGIYEYDVKHNNIIKLKELPQDIDLRNFDFGNALDNISNTLYIFDSSCKIWKLNLNQVNNQTWINEYQPKHQHDITRKQFLESYVINNKIHIHYMDKYFRHFCHVIYDLTNHKIDKINTNYIDQYYHEYRVRYPHVLYHEKDCKLIFVHVNLYQEPDLISNNRNNSPDNLWYDLNECSRKWNPYYKGILTTRVCDCEFDTTIGIEDIVFSFYQSHGQMMISCFDLSNHIIYESEKVLPSSTFWNSRTGYKQFQRNFINMNNGYIYYIHTTDKCNFKHQNMKISMYDIVPDSLKLIKQTINNKLVFGFIRIKCQNYINSFPSYLTKIVLKYYTNFT